ncbi:MAG: amidohydrolase [Anaerolineae bacterium]|jgi:amidohydrolase
MLERARAIQDHLTAWRRDIHSHPELGFQETRTATLVAEQLSAMGYRVRTGVGRTGVVGEHGAGHPIVALRADMDALPIQETSDVPYVSRTPGVMHACGHDCHTAILLGVAKLLSKEDFPGTLRLLFQPAEEIQDDEGKSGAQRMIEDGAIEDVDLVLALHVDANTPVGTVTLGAGSVNAGVDAFQATIAGRGGHGAYPHLTVDPIHIAAHAILALHAIVSRRIHPRDPAVISVGSIHGGEAGNVIPQQVQMRGTIRYTEVEVRERLHAEIERALQITQTMGADYTLTIERGYPPMVNAPEAVDLVSQVAEAMLGADNVNLRQQEMGAEDFGYFSRLSSGAMFWLGCRIEGDERYHHHPRFDVDERCLPIGAAMLAQATLRRLRG